MGCWFLTASTLHGTDHDGTNKIQIMVIKPVTEHDRLHTKNLAEAVWNNWLLINSNLEPGFADEWHHRRLSSLVMGQKFGGCHIEIQISGIFLIWPFFGGKKIPHPLLWESLAESTVRMEIYSERGSSLGSGQGCQTLGLQAGCQTDKVTQKGYRWGSKNWPERPLGYMPRVQSKPWQRRRYPLSAQHLSHSVLFLSLPSCHLWTLELARYALHLI